MPASIEISRYRRSDRPRVFEFLSTVYPLARANRLIAQWDWKYDAYPFNREPDPYILLLTEREKIIGMLGALTLRVSIRGAELSVSSGCDAMIHPAYRGQRLFSKMIDYYIQDRPVGIGWGNPASNHIWNDATTGNARMIPLFAFSIFNGYGLGRALDTTGAGKVEISARGEFDERFDDLWQSVRGNYPVLLVRDQRYLSWRFDQRPDCKYARLIASRGEDLLGYLVTRIAEKRGARVGYLVDWMVRDQSWSTFSLLVRHAFARLRREGVMLISTRTTTRSFRRMLYRLGFIPWFWGRREYAITQVSGPDANLQIFRDMDQWFSTMGDGDLEMGY